MDRKSEKRDSYSTAAWGFFRASDVIIVFASGSVGGEGEGEEGCSEDEPQLADEDHRRL